MDSHHLLFSIVIDASVTKGISSYAENLGFTHELVSLCISGEARLE